VLASDKLAAAWRCGDNSALVLSGEPETSLVGKTVRSDRRDRELYPESLVYDIRQG